MEGGPGHVKLNLAMAPDGQVSDVDTGDVYDLAAVAARIPWVDFQWTPGPGMPRHSYVVLGRCDDSDWDLLDFAIKKHPASYMAYFRGYQYPMRYLELGDGYRYWLTFAGVLMLNRCTLDSSEPPRRVDQGARPICWQEWGALEYYERGSDWPEEWKRKYPERFGSPSLPACRHGEIREGDRVTHLPSWRTGVVERIYPEQALPVYVLWDKSRKHSFVGKASLRTPCCCVLTPE